VKQFETLQLLASHNWGHFFIGSIPDELFASFLQITLSMLQPMEQDHYFSLDGPGVSAPPRLPAESSLHVLQALSPPTSPS